MTKFTILSSADKLAEIRRLYFATTRQTIERDFATAVQLLTSMESEDERERARVFMDGLIQMRSDWAREGRAKGSKPGRKPPAGKPAKLGSGSPPANSAAKGQPRQSRRRKPSDD